MRKQAARKRAHAAKQVADIYAKSPLVVSQRLSRYATSNPTAMLSNGIEAQRMVLEKASASVASMTAMGLAAFRWNVRFAMFFARPSLGLARGVSAAKASALIEDGAIDVLNQGLAPIRKRVSSNARRLSR